MPTTEQSKKPDTERTLANYRLHYINQQFPLLSFIYAVMAGGEHTLYCDRTDEFVAAYFEGSDDRSYVQEFFSIMGRFEALAHEGSNPERTKVVHATPDDWDQILDLLKNEMRNSRGPAPIW